MLVLLDRDLGGQNRPPRHKFSATTVGVVFNQWGGGLNLPPTPRQIERWCLYAYVNLAWSDVFVNSIIAVELEFEYDLSRVNLLRFVAIMEGCELEVCMGIGTAGIPRVFPRVWI